MSRTVVIASGVRTATGDFGGALAGIVPCEPGAAVARDAMGAAVARDGIAQARPTPPRP